MSPSDSRDSPVSMASRDRHKMRKPAVEKLRRDRINGCIEQLKVLLEEEFLKRDPDAKLEKADVLEMTVGFLRRRRLRPRDGGYSRCREETPHFLSAGSPQEVTPQGLQYAHDALDLPSHGLVRAEAKPPPPGTDRPVWRP